MKWLGQTRPPKDGPAFEVACLGLLQMGGEAVYAGFELVVAQSPSAVGVPALFQGVKESLVLEKAAPPEPEYS